MRRVCRAEIGDLVSALSRLSWLPSTDGFAMIDRWPEGLMPVEPIFELVAAQYPGRRRGMTCFSRLVPGQWIEPHFDQHDNRCDVRVHVPIVTNPSCVFVSGKQAAHMEAGWVWEIDPRVTHCTGNGGDTERVHLFFNMRAD